MLILLLFILPLPQLLWYIDPGPAVLRGGRIHDNPDRTDQQVYSCGSLVSKMRRGGCIDSHYRITSQEKSEG